MKYLVLSLVFSLFFVGCAGNKNKDEISLDSDMGAATASEPEAVQKDDVQKDDFAISDSSESNTGASISDPETSPIKPSITSNKKTKKTASSKMTLSKECKVRAKASASAKVVKKMKKGAAVSVSSVGKAWYKVSSGGFVPKSCFK
jgi:cytoskeletal protein RodZ